jgi:hypothetical protein
LGGEIETPALDRLVADGQVWSPHYAAEGWTKPSHASLLTGLDPPVHGAGEVQSPIDPRIETLAERFQRNGYLTAGLARHVWLDARFGFSRGFDEYRVVEWQLPQMVRWTVNWLGRHRDRPFFFFLHFMEVHSDFHRLPYEAPQSSRGLVEERFGVSGYGCRQELCASRLLHGINQGEIEPLPGEAEILRFLYGRGVRFVDRQLGLLFETLRDLGLYEQLTIVLTSDHGEAFLEHGRVLHNEHWEEVLRVPLIFKWPSGALAGDRRWIPSSSVDVAPTLLAAQGLDASGLPGQPLVPGRRAQPVFAGNAWRMVLAGGLKGVFDGVSARLYDLSSDPGESRDLALERPEDLERLRQMVELRRRENEQRIEGLGRRTARADVALTRDELARLEALGYVDRPSHRSQAWPGRGGP